jgi:hypothetical protein
MAIPPPSFTGSGPTPAPTPLVDNSWAGANDGRGVLEPTTGDAQQLPSQHMPGSAAGARPTAYTTAAQAVYPTLTGIGDGRLPVAERPASFSSDAPADFARWHSAYQVEWLKNRHTAITPVYRINDASGKAVAFFALTSDNRPVNLMTMTKADYGKLSDIDKSTGLGRIGWHLEGLGRFEALGLSTDYSTVSSALANLQTAINDSGLPDADKAVFFAQFQLLRGGDPRSTAAVADADMMANITGAIATDVYAERIAAVSERLDRAIRFYEAPTPRPVYLEAEITLVRPIDRVSTRRDTSKGQPHLVFNASTTDRAGLSAGYAEFMRAERAILANQTMRAIQASLPYSDPRLDVANLINFFQLRYEDEARATADAGTEEIRQLNKLLQDYAIMQQLVQKQIGFYDPSKTDEKRRFMNVGAWEDGFLDDRQSVDDISAAGETDWGSFRQRGIAYRARDESDTTVWGGFVAAADRIKHAKDTDAPKFHWVLALEGNSTLHSQAMTWAQVDVAASRGSPAWTENRLNDLQTRALSMFMADYNMGDNRTHPLEELYGAGRPSISIIDTRDNTSDHSLKRMSKNEWDSFATQLSETVTILNQQNQIRQNEIQNAEKQANRHFELGNNALRKMNDILMSIGRI